MSFWLPGELFVGPDQWEALLRHTESLASTNPQLLEVAGELHPEVWINRRHLPFPLHRLYPHEMALVLEQAGLGLPDLDLD